MTRPEALAALQRLAHGLEPDLAGVSRMRERIAASDDREALEDVLVELGVKGLLEGEVVSRCRVLT